MGPGVGGAVRLQDPGQVWCDVLRREAVDLKLLSLKRKSFHTSISPSVPPGCKGYRSSYSKLAREEDHLNQNLHLNGVLGDCLHSHI